MMLKTVDFITRVAKNYLACLFIFFVIPFSFTQKGKEKTINQEEINNEVIVKQLKIDSLEQLLYANTILINQLSQQLQEEQLKTARNTNNLTLIGNIYNVKKDFSRFNENYIRNDQYEKYSPSDLEAIARGQVLVNYALITEPSTSEMYQMALKMQDFNANRLALDSITKYVLEEKFDSKKVSTALNTLRNLPLIDPFSKMHSYKVELHKLLEEYEKVNCIAKESFEDLINKFMTLGSLPSDKVKLYNFFYLNRGISEKYRYIKKVYDALISNIKLYDSPGYDLPDTCVKEILEVPQSTEEKEKPVEESTPAEE